MQTTTTKTPQDMQNKVRNYEECVCVFLTKHLQDLTIFNPMSLHNQKWKGDDASRGKKMLPYNLRTPYALRMRVNKNFKLGWEKELFN